MVSATPYNFFHQRRGKNTKDVYSQQQIITASLKSERSTKNDIPSVGILQCSSECWVSRKKVFAAMSLDCPLVGILQCSSVGILQCSSECRVRKNLLQWASIPISESIVTWTKKRGQKRLLRTKKTFAKNLEFQNQKTGFKKEEKKII